MLPMGLVGLGALSMSAHHESIFVMSGMEGTDMERIATSALTSTSPEK